MRVRAIVPTMATAVAVCLGAAGPSVAHVKTRGTIFEPFAADGSPTIPVRETSGYCWTGSLATPRRDAWRCFRGNFIVDPCFSSAAVPGTVVCPNIGMINGVELDLTKPLPRKYANHARPSLRLQPWNLELTSGRHCVFATGATTIVDGKRLNYGCNGQGNGVLWGYPNRRSQPWTIPFGPYNATRLTGRASIRQAWM